MNTHNDTEFSIIAQLVFAADPNINLSNLVRELDTVLQRINCIERHLAWDYDDVAIFDMPGTRIILALINAPRSGVAKSLTVSVGPSVLKWNGFAKLNYANLCTRLVERLQARLHADGIIWHDSQDLVEPDLIDAITAHPVSSARGKGKSHPIFAHVSELTIDEILMRGNRSAGPPDMKPDNDAPDLPLRHHDAELCRLREALYPAIPATATPQQNSAQMRLAIYTMNATLIAVSLPVGVAILTHSLIKGDNLRATTGALVGTGLTLTLLQGPLLSQILAIAG